MIVTSVSNIDSYRFWRDAEDLDLQWILDRLTKREQSEAMKVGEAFHKAIELAGADEVATISANGYQFEFLNNCEIDLAPLRELSLSKRYGNVFVRGRVDAISGLLITDYKSTSQFDPDRLLDGYQWRYYLDMAEANRFRWDVFVLKETDDPGYYLISDFHRIEQTRYPGLEADCRVMAEQFEIFAKNHLPQASPQVVAAS